MKHSPLHHLLIISSFSLTAVGCNLATTSQDSGLSEAPPTSTCYYEAERVFGLERKSSHDLRKRGFFNSGFDQPKLWKFENSYLYGYYDDPSDKSQEGLEPVIEAIDLNGETLWSARFEAEEHGHFFGLFPIALNYRNGQIFSLSHKGQLSTFDPASGQQTPLLTIERLQDRELKVLFPGDGEDLFYGIENVGWGTENLELVTVKDSGGSYRHETTKLPPLLHFDIEATSKGPMFHAQTASGNDASAAQGFGNFTQVINCPQGNQHTDETFFEIIQDNTRQGYKVNANGSIEKFDMINCQVDETIFNSGLSGKVDLSQVLIDGNIIAFMQTIDQSTQQAQLIIFDFSSEEKSIFSIYDIRDASFDINAQSKRFAITYKTRKSLDIYAFDGRMIASRRTSDEHLYFERPQFLNGDHLIVSLEDYTPVDQLQDRETLMAIDERNGSKFYVPASRSRNAYKISSQPIDADTETINGICKITH